MVSVTPLHSSSVAPDTDSSLRGTARNLHISLFTEFLRQADVMSGLGMSDGPLTYFNTSIIEQIATDIADRDPDFTERLYRQLQHTS